MKHAKTQLSAIAATLSSVLFMHSAQAAPPICAKGASWMGRSCHFERHEEYNATLAGCALFADWEDQSECRQEARAERDEAAETCDAQQEARLDVCELLDENRYTDPLTIEAITFVDPNDIGTVHDNNPFVILQAGHTHVLSSEDEIIVVHATDEVRDIQGVLCRVVVDIAVEEEFDEEEGEYEYTAIEVTDDWFAQDDENNVYYCGEISRNYEDGLLRDLDGSFESGLDLANGGLLTAAMPVAGDAHRQEYAIGEAEDIVQYLDTATSPSEEEGGDNESFPCDGNCLMTQDSSPLEPETTEYKYYLPGIGFVLAVSLEDGEIEEDGREELVCSGDSLDILNDEDCGIEDPQELLEELCDLHDELCEDDED